MKVQPLLVLGLCLVSASFGYAAGTHRTSKLWAAKYKEWDKGWADFCHNLNKSWGARALAQTDKHREALRRAALDVRPLYAMPGSKKKEEKPS